MATLTITTRDDSAAFAAEQARLKGLASAEEYIAGLLREAHLHHARKKLEAMIQEGLDSGPPEPMTREDWDSIRREGLKRIEVERASR